MSVAVALEEFKTSVAQCDSLIANAHQTNVSGEHILPDIDRRQITVAAFLNMFIAWEAFLEATFSALLSGALPISGNVVIKYASPLGAENARKMIIGAQRHFDYANHQNFTKIAMIYFQNCEPFQSHIGSVYGYLEDLRTMRNASAHLSSTTKQALESLALRLLAKPSLGISLYDLLTANDPKTPLGATISRPTKATFWLLPS